MLKACAKCKEIKDAEEFDVKADGSLTAMCSLCRAKYNRAMTCCHNKRKTQCKGCDLEGYVKQLVRIHNRRVCGSARGAFENLGCCAQDFIEWINIGLDESGFSWNQHGTVWELDHRMPLKETGISFQERVSRLNFTNVRPLRKSVNRRR